MNDSILEIRDLSVLFHKKGEISSFTAVNSLSFSFERGSFVSLGGESGSGKTVTALSVLRLLPSALIRGQIHYRGKSDGSSEDVLKLSQKEMTMIRGRRIAAIFQDPGAALNPVMKVGEQVEEAYRAHFNSDKNSAKKKTLDLLAAVRIKETQRVYESFPHELSGGMKQRAMIAMALVMEPELLICDEPTASLDPDTALEIMDLLANAQKQRGLTIFFITHHISLAAGFSDALLVMKSGRLLETLNKGPEGFVPKEEYTRKLFRADLSGLTPKTRIEV